MSVKLTYSLIFFFVLFSTNAQRCDFKIDMKDENGSRLIVSKEVKWAESGKLRYYVVFACRTHTPHQNTLMVYIRSNSPSNLNLSVGDSVIFKFEDASPIIKHSAMNTKEVIMNGFYQTIATIEFEDVELKKLGNQPLLSIQVADFGEGHIKSKNLRKVRKEALCAYEVVR